jgi:hypothetical protein
MNDIEWADAVEAIRPHIVRISTPDGNGTGFLVARSSTHKVIGIATAAHVIDHCHYWEEPIRIEHLESGNTRLLRVDNRAMFINEDKDTAAIVCEDTDLPLPKAPLPLLSKDKHTRVGVDVGWLGYPAIARQHLCFFTGRISCYLQDQEMYLIDGVAINGVSGGPTFCIAGSDIQVVGVISAYIVNRSTGETLPGVSVARDVVELHEIIGAMKSVDEAKEKETPPSPPPPPPTEKG